MNEKHRETHAWLESLYGGEDVPQYEINERTISILQELMSINSRQEAIKTAMQKDLQRKSEEYTLEAERIGKILQRLGLLPEVLSQSGMTSLHTLCQTALNLGTKDASSTSLLMATADHCKSCLDADRELKREQQRMVRLSEKEDEVNLRHQILKKTLEKMEIEAKQQKPELMKKSQRASFYQTKCRDYRNNIQNMKDITLARVKVEEAKLELASLESQLSELINLMHM